MNLTVLWFFHLGFVKFDWFQILLELFVNVCVNFLIFLVVLIA